ncbi:hypothetical protein Tco_0496659 [Tanacetum coccineum]
MAITKQVYPATSGVCVVLGPGFENGRGGGGYHGRVGNGPGGHSTAASDLALDYTSIVENLGSNMILLRRERSRSPRHEYKNKERRESTVFKRLGSRGRSTSVHSDSRQESSRYTENYSESEDSEGGHWKSKLRRKKSSVEDDDLSQPWVCAETDPFTSRIRHFDFPKTRMPSHVKTYNGSEDPEDHLKIFQAAAKTERWAMPTWCHMFNSTLTGNARVWFDDLPPESIDIYNI